MRSVHSVIPQCHSLPLVSFHLKLPNVSFPVDTFFEWCRRSLPEPSVALCKCSLLLFHPLGPLVASSEWSLVVAHSSDSSSANQTMATRFKTFAISLAGISAGLVLADVIWKPSFILDLPPEYYEMERKKKQLASQSQSDSSASRDKSAIL